MITPEATYRVFIHNPPSEPHAGSCAVRYQHGPERAGTQEWRTNLYEQAVSKAVRIADGADPDNKVKNLGWVTVDAKDEHGSWRPLYSVAGYGF
jgi:hypothetical protein